MALAAPGRRASEPQCLCTFHLPQAEISHIIHSPPVLTLAHKYLIMPHHRGRLVQPVIPRNEARTNHKPRVTRPIPTDRNDSSRGLLILLLNPSLNPDKEKIRDSEFLFFNILDLSAGIKMACHQLLLASEQIWEISFC
jgi:hypothetical protein